MLSASSSNNHSLFSFGRNGVPVSTDAAEKTTSTSFDFLPSVSFDDLQSSLESASTDFKLTQFPSPSGQGSILEAQGMVDKMPERERSNVTRHGGTTRVAIQQPPPPRTSRSGSIIRRPSTSNRTPAVPPSTASVISGGASTVVDVPTAPAAMRPRRQSHYPPLSNTNIGKPPRKSVGPGVLDSDFSNRSATTQRRRPSLASNTDRPAPDSARSSVDGSSRLFGDHGTRNLTASRASKAKSVQPPPRASQTMLSPDDSILSLDGKKHSGTPGMMPRSPRTNANGSAKRMSVMPGMNHATGLGARTISPTDTRRMKRLSTKGLPPPPNGNTQIGSGHGSGGGAGNGSGSGSGSGSAQSPATDVRPNSRSPSMLPRKTSTPSSSRTTPDPNRKSYSSGLSVGSVASFNTVRTSTGSIQRSLLQAGTSRLPAPKVMNLHNHTNAEDEEDVPPVPAIPKAYESPKESPAEISFLDKRKSTLTFDASSIHSASTGSLSGHPVLEPSVKVQRKLSTRKASHNQNVTLDLDKKGNVSAPKKNLQPLRLPPITLGPLSTPTTARIAALQEQGPSTGNLTPPPARQVAKTPTTPMTASKSSFFSRHRGGDKPEVPNARSSSSVHARADSPLQTQSTSSTESVAAAIGIRQVSSKPAASPVLTSSLPKNGLESSGFMQRTKTGGSFSAAPGSEVGPSIIQQRPSGPRAPNSTKPRPAKSPPPFSSPEEPPTPSSMSSLRRKLSLSWKRSASKASGHQPSGDKTADQHQRQESMPPPRLPTSSTLNNIGSIKPPSPTTSSKSTAASTYLESRRRKSSASSLNAIVAQDRTRNDLWTIGKKELGSESVAERPPISHSTSVMHKILKPKASTSTVRHHDVWTADLDKDDLIAEEEMRKLGARRKETELAAKTLDALRKRATPKERVSPQDAIRIAMLNIYERGEIVDYNDIYFCGTQNAAKVIGDLKSTIPNFGYDDERGDYTIVPGDHLAYRYEIIDVLGKGSFGQVVRCIDHKTGALVAVKIIRNKNRFHQQALVEVNILQKIREWVSHFLPSDPSRSGSPPQGMPQSIVAMFCANKSSNGRTLKTSTAWSTSPTASTSVGIFASRPNFLI